jgi:hypothetical protein
MVERRELGKIEYSMLVDEFTCIPHDELCCCCERTWIIYSGH